MNSILHGFSRRFFILLFLVIAAASRVCAQSSTDQAAATTNSTEEQITALQLQLTNAWHQVETIVNQPVPAYRMDSSYSVSVYSPGWFHPGASIPDFNNVDVRQSQQLIYTATWVSSDITPTMMFHGSDLEFNAMTKLFYTNRALPKKKLTEAEMLQINSFYRTIGHCQTEIAGLQPPPAAEATVDTQNGTNDVAPTGALATIEHMPRQTRILYGGLAIGSLLVLVIALRLFGKKGD
jgi:hypothetical protein